MRSSVSLAVAVLALATSSASAQQPLTARDVVERIKQNIGVPWTEPTVDTFKDGDPATPVTGIAVTMMATLDVLRRAADRGANLVITHEPTFYDHFDKLEPLDAEHDSVTAAKRACSAGRAPAARASSSTGCLGPRWRSSRHDPPRRRDHRGEEVAPR